VPWTTSSVSLAPRAGRALVSEPEGGSPAGAPEDSRRPIATDAGRSLPSGRRRGSRPERPCDLAAHLTPNVGGRSRREPLDIGADTGGCTFAPTHDD
jgi:hypothetical protein